MIPHADIIVCQDQHLIDPKQSKFLLQLPKDTIIIFDDAEFLEETCLSTFSIHMDTSLLDQANHCIKLLEQKVFDLQKNQP